MGGNAWELTTGPGTWQILDKCFIIIVIIKESQLTMEYGGWSTRGGCSYRHLSEFFILLGYWCIDIINIRFTTCGKLNNAPSPKISMFQSLEPVNVTLNGKKKKKKTLQM